jgi:hypothetical protein
MGFILPVFCIALVACFDTDTDAGAESASEAITTNLATATDTITLFNNTGVIVDSGSFNFAGTVSPTPLSSVSAGGSDFYTETGIGTTTSFHVTYTARTGGKVCHFNSASFLNGSSCSFTNNGQSQGGTFATCTATLTSFNNTICSQSVTFKMQ